VLQIATPRRISEQSKNEVRLPAVGRQGTGGDMREINTKIWSENLNEDLEADCMMLNGNHQAWTVKLNRRYKPFN
jgi:hypothetical protein